MTILASRLRINDFYRHMKLVLENVSKELVDREVLCQKHSSLSYCWPHEDHQALVKFFLSSLNIQDYTSVPSNCFQHILRICLQRLNFKQTSTASTYPTLGSKYFPTVISSVGFSISSLNCSLLFARMLA